ncbi:hypothetical protein [Streptomyces sp. NPDC058108]|uniref:hypothetical protein n=1 Tax=Streptomyces sp. NPDC058108 TaxID=3346344 RepID=UPI0036E871CF
MVARVLTAFRRTDLPEAGVPDTVPIRVRGNARPTGADVPGATGAAVGGRRVPFLLAPVTGRRRRRGTTVTWAPAPACPVARRTEGAIS